MKCKKCGKENTIVKEEDMEHMTYYWRCVMCSKYYFHINEIEENMVKKLLVKFPSRERFDRFFRVFDLLTYYTNDKVNTYFLLNFDSDDVSMNYDKVFSELKYYIDDGYNIEVIYGKSENKIHAVNKDLNKTVYQDWDVLLLMSDDMTPTYKGYDNVIRGAMDLYYPDTDGVLYYPDGFTELNTMPIIGKKYYKRFGYIYHPKYESFFVDNEFQMVSRMLKKEMKGDFPLFLHHHPVWTGTGNDALYERNNGPWAKDEALFHERMKNNFDIAEK